MGPKNITMEYTNLAHGRLNLNWAPNIPLLYSRGPQLLINVTNEKILLGPRLTVASLRMWNQHNTMHPLKNVTAKIKATINDTHVGRFNSIFTSGWIPNPNCSSKWRAPPTTLMCCAIYIKEHCIHKPHEWLGITYINVLLLSHLIIHSPLLKSFILRWIRAVIFGNKSQI